MLQEFPDLDKMLSGLTTQPKNVTSKTARVGIDTLIYLKQTLRTTPALAEALKGINTIIPSHSATTADALPITATESASSTTLSHPLISAIISNLTDDALSKMEDSILTAITESTAFSKSAHEMRHQECFALRTGIHGLLDVARKTFLQTVEDLYRVSSIL